MNLSVSREILVEMLNEDQDFNENLKFFTEEQQLAIKNSFINEAQEQLTEISFGGIKNVGRLAMDKVNTYIDKGLDKAVDASYVVSDKIKHIKTNIDSSIKDVKDAYYTGNIQELEDKLLEIVIQSVNKINEKRIKMGQVPISPKSVLTSISNKASKRFK